jgi:hypothetical protein
MLITYLDPIIERLPEPQNPSGNNMKSKRKVKNKLSAHAIGRAMHVYVLLALASHLKVLIVGFDFAHNHARY